MELWRRKHFNSQESGIYYSKTGKYNVTLTVKNAAGSNKTTKSNYIKVSQKSSVK